MKYLYKGMETVDSPGYNNILHKYTAVRSL